MTIAGGYLFGAIPFALGNFHRQEPDPIWLGGVLLAVLVGCQVFGRMTLRLVAAPAGK